MTKETDVVLPKEEVAFDVFVQSYRNRKMRQRREKEVRFREAPIRGLAQKDDQESYALCHDLLNKLSGETKFILYVIFNCPEKYGTKSKLLGLIRRQFGSQKTKTVLAELHAFVRDLY